jgi:hypothetical protein
MLPPRTTISSLPGPSARSCSWASSGASDPRVRAPPPGPARPLHGHEPHACFRCPATVLVPNQPVDPEGAELGHATSAGGHVGQQTSDSSSARLQTSCKCVGPSPQTSRKHPTAETPRTRAKPHADPANPLARFASVCPPSQTTRYIGAPGFEPGTSPTRIARLVTGFVMETPANRLFVVLAACSWALEILGSIQGVWAVRCSYCPSLEWSYATGLSGVRVDLWNGSASGGSGDGLGVSERLEGELEQGWVDVVEIDVDEMV